MLSTRTISDILNILTVLHQLSIIIGNLLNYLTTGDQVNTLTIGDLLNFLATGDK